MEISVVEGFLSNNSFESYMIAIAVFVFVIIIGLVLNEYLISKVKKLSIKLDTYYALALIIILSVVLYVPESAHKWLFTILGIWLLSRLITPIKMVILYLVRSIFASGEEDGNVVVKFIQNFVAWFIWIFGVLTVLANAGFNINSLLIGLGVGGIAIGFALKEVVEDVFGTISIYSEKLFDVGDLVSIGGYKGTVSKIGLLVTTIVIYDKREILIHNSTFLRTVFENFRKEIKGPLFSFDVSVPRDTDKARAQKVMDEIAKAIDSHSGVNLVRVVMSDIKPNYYTINAKCFAVKGDGRFDVKGEIIITIVGILKKNKIGGSPCCSVKN